MMTRLFGMAQYLEGSVERNFGDVDTSRGLNHVLRRVVGESYRHRMPVPLDKHDELVFQYRTEIQHNRVTVVTIFYAIDWDGEVPVPVPGRQPLVRDMYTPLADRLRFLAGRMFVGDGSHIVSQNDQGVLITDVIKETIRIEQQNLEAS